MLSFVEMAKKAIKINEFRQAVQYLEMAKVYPHNLGEGKLQGIQENDVDYWLGCAYKGMGDSEKAIEFWELASQGLSEPTAAWFYNDQQPDKIFYQGLAFLELNRKKKADIRFNKLLEYGEKHLSDHVKIDYFAVSMPDLLIWEEDLQARNEIHCRYMIGLGSIGLGLVQISQDQLKKVCALDNNHIGALTALRMNQ